MNLLKRISHERLLRRICFSAITAFLAVGFFSSVDSNAMTSQDMSGSDRFTTAINISKDGWSESSENVILVNSNAVSDSLSVSPLAKKLNAPVLLTNNSVLTSSTYDEIKRLSPKNIIIIGGENSVSGNIAGRLSNEGYSVTRIDGSSRVETSLNIAKKLHELQGEDFKQAFVVNGMKGLSDAAGIGSVAGREDSPIIFAQESGSEITKNALSELGVSKVFLIGGNVSLPDSFMNVAGDVERISGDNRQATNLAIIDKFFQNSSTVYLADDGQYYPSRLIDSVLINAGIIASNSQSGASNITEGPVMLVGAKGFNENQKNWIKNNEGSIQKLVQVSGGDLLRFNIRTMVDPDSIDEASKNAVNLASSTPVVLKVKTGDKRLGINAMTNALIFNSDGSVDFDKTKVASAIQAIGIGASDTKNGDMYAFWRNGDVVVQRGGVSYYPNFDATASEVINSVKSGKSSAEVIYNKSEIEVPKEAKKLTDTYVLIDISDQNMQVYKNGKSILYTPVVTGNPNRGMATPPGIFNIKSKMRNVVLRGPGYASPVKYWIPFNGSIGIHDSYWQPAYGGSRYLRYGSHGCVNTPLNKVSQLYNMVSVGTNVIVVK